MWRVPSELGTDDIELTALPLNLMLLTRADGPRLLIEKISTWFDEELLVLPAERPATGAYPFMSRSISRILPL